MYARHGTGDGSLPLHRTPAHRIVAAGLSHVPEGRGIFANMSVRENLELGAYLRRDTGVAADLQRVFALFPRIAERLHQTAGTLSGGEQQMLAIGRALMSAPQLLLLDEPSIGLAPNLVREILHLLTRMRDEGLTILLVEQDAHAALRIADRGYVMETGRIVIEEAAQELIASDRMKRAYLGMV